jgi:hypothetical protein
MGLAKLNDFKAVIAAGRHFVANIESDFEKMSSIWCQKKEKYSPEQYLGCLLARQVSIAQLFGNDPTIWNAHIGTIYLRVMLELLVKIYWISEIPEERTKAVIGGDITSLEGDFNDMADLCSSAEIPPEFLPFRDEVADWLKNARKDFNGVKSQKIPDMRGMAQQADPLVLDLYRKYHTIFSSSLHSNWNHIARANLTRTHNPLHHYIFIPTVQDMPIDLSFILLSAEFCELSMKEVAKVFKLLSFESSAQVTLISELEECLKSQSI